MTTLDTLTDPAEPTRRSLLALAACAPLPWILPAMARTQAEPAVCTYGGLAIGGHDPVTYFTAGVPEEGNSDYALKWRGALWLFVSEASMDHFTRTPHAFAPRYGGYCAMSMADGHLIPGDPQVWEIDETHLYLFANTSERDAWRADVKGNISRADVSWPSILKV
ncbi:YHS domain-containing (seleno)protein [Acidimangrovimonas sediminis]|uniref:YHS domain-containing (seleno)protein n=1 Tax=Acidimangrovimonas sediminis TaxID=2056283 RepID=UPI000C7FBC6A|nr:YHS domain-containing (seleno)protein [Acidimangrovimonas sediminis]